VRQEHNGGFITSLPTNKLTATVNTIQQTQDDINANKLIMKAYQEAMGRAQSCEGAKPHAFGRSIFKDAHSWGGEAPFNKHIKVKDERNKLHKTMQLIKHITKLATPNVIGTHLTDKMDVAIHADAAGINEGSGKAHASALVLGLKGGPLLCQKEICLEDTNLTPEECDQVKDDVSFWETCAVTEVTDHLGERLRNKFVTIHVDNTNELYALVNPATSKNPIVQNAAISWHLKLMELEAIPFMAYVKSERNASDLWTRESEMWEAQEFLEPYLTRTGEGTKIRAAKAVRTKVADLLGDIGAAHDSYCKRHNVDKVKSVQLLEKEGKEGEGEGEKEVIMDQDLAKRMMDSELSKQQLWDEFLWSAHPITVENELTADMKEEKYSLTLYGENLKYKQEGIWETPRQTQAVVRCRWDSMGTVTSTDKYTSFRKEDKEVFKSSIDRDMKELKHKFQQEGFKTLRLPAGPPGSGDSEMPMELFCIMLAELSKTISELRSERLI
jgi:hypothetical protein